jgi:hypothetical protein
MRIEKLTPAWLGRGCGPWWALGLAAGALANAILHVVSTKFAAFGPVAMAFGYA